MFLGGFLIFGVLEASFYHNFIGFFERQPASTRFNKSFFIEFAGGFNLFEPFFLISKTSAGLSDSYSPVKRPSKEILGLKSFLSTSY